MSAALPNLVDYTSQLLDRAGQGTECAGKVVIALSDLRSCGSFLVLMITGRRSERQLKKTLYKIHKWVGLTLGVLLLLQAATGLMMAHKETLAAWSSRSFQIDQTLPHRPLDDIVAAVGSELPGYRLSRIIYSRNAELPLIARLTPPDGSQFHVALINPTRPAVVQTSPMWRFPLQLAERLHVSLLIGTLGHYVLLIEGLGLLFLGISGLVVWWPYGNRFRQALKIHRKPPVRFMRDLHSVPGALVSFLMLVAGATGAMLVADAAVKTVVGAVAPLKPEFKLSLAEVDSEEPVISWQQAFDQLRRNFPDGRLRQLRFLGSDERVLVAIMVAEDAANPRAHHIAGVDRWTNELIVFADGNELPAGSAIIEWILPIHTGEAYGKLRPILMSILGISLGGMAVTGFLLWLRKRRPRRARSVAAAAASSARSGRG